MRSKILILCVLLFEVTSLPITQLSGLEGPSPLTNEVDNTESFVDVLRINENDETRNSTEITLPNEILADISVSPASSDKNSSDNPDNPFRQNIGFGVNEILEKTKKNDLIDENKKSSDEQIPKDNELITEENYTEPKPTLNTSTELERTEKSREENSGASESDSTVSISVNAESDTSTTSATSYKSGTSSSTSDYFDATTNSDISTFGINVTARFRTLESTRKVYTEYQSITNEITTANYIRDKKTTTSEEKSTQIDKSDPTTMESMTAKLAFANLESTTNRNTETFEITSTLENLPTTYTADVVTTEYTPKSTSVVAIGSRGNFIAITSTSKNVENIEDQFPTKLSVLSTSTHDTTEKSQIFEERTVAEQLFVNSIGSTTSITTTQIDNSPNDQTTIEPIIPIFTFQKFENTTNGNIKAFKNTSTAENLPRTYTTPTTGAGQNTHKSTPAINIGSQSNFVQTQTLTGTPKPVENVEMITENQLTKKLSIFLNSKLTTTETEQAFPKNIGSTRNSITGSTKASDFGFRKSSPFSKIFPEVNVPRFQVTHLETTTKANLGFIKESTSKLSGGIFSKFANSGYNFRSIKSEDKLKESFTIRDFKEFSKVSFRDSQVKKNENASPTIESAVFDGVFTIGGRNQNRFLNFEESTTSNPKPGSFESIFSNISKKYQSKYKYSWSFSSKEAPKPIENPNRPLFVKNFLDKLTSTTPSSIKLDTINLGKTGSIPRVEDSRAAYKNLFLHDSTVATYL